MASDNDLRMSAPSVVLVDNDADTREMYEWALTDEGFRVVLASSVADGLAVAAAVLPDVIVTGLGFSGADGFDLLAQVRTDPRTAHIPVVVLSGWVNNQSERRALEAGAVAFVPKPCSVDALASVLRAVLRERSVNVPSDRLAG